MKDLKRIDSTWLNNVCDSLAQTTGFKVASTTLRWSVLFESEPHKKRSKAYNRFILSVGPRKYLILWGFDLSDSVHPTIDVRRWTITGDTFRLSCVTYPDYTQKDTYYAPAPLLEIISPVVCDLLESGDIPYTLGALLDAGLAPADLVHLQRTKEGIERKIQEKLKVLNITK
jgi:hypothetical protein